MSQSILSPAMTTQLRQWDKGIVGSEMIRMGLFPRKKLPTTHREAGKPAPLLETGTFQGTKIAMTEVYHRVGERFRSFFDVTNFESSVPQDISFKAKQQLFTFQTPGSDKYSPHLNMIPPSNQTPILQIFDAMRLFDTGTVVFRVLPGKFLEWAHGDPIRDSIAGIEERNRTLRADGTDIFADPNIGDREDWYTDKVFAQQQFTGPNPTTIQRAPEEWIRLFSRAAEVQRNGGVLQILTQGLSDQSLYIQDCSYFRKAWGAPPTASMKSDDGERFACASVTLFRLQNDGKLHPLSIIIDYKGSLDNSVVIFNKRLSPNDSTLGEANDWPWRYAKTCAQVSDWMRHELTVHLVNTHFVEEVVIVAAHRSFETDHVVFRLLEPHWLKTLSLNAVARSTLVPSVISKIIGVTEDQMYAYTRYEYANFNWEQQYVPNDLEARGFPLEELLTGGEKYHNYTYGRNMIIMWRVLRTFVSSVIATAYTSDDQVAQDQAITAWCNEMRSPSGGQMGTFPMIKTIDSLVDAITMCIHIASPQHTAVNYLQDYYQAFVINKPPALFSPPPTNLPALNAYKERDLLAALPLKNPQEWLLSSHLPHLLSYHVPADQNLVNYAISIAQLAAQKGAEGDEKEAKIATAAGRLFEQLVELIEVFRKNSEDMDDQTVPYDVMNPEATAVSILI